jgi:hypothetical protein
MPIDRRRLLAGALLAAAAAQAPGTGAVAAERRERFATRALVVDGLAGSLRVVGEDRADMQVTLSGDGLDAVRLEPRGDTLHLDAAAATGGSYGSVTIGRNLVVAGNGGRATSRIGGTSATVVGNGRVIVGPGGSGDAAHLDVELRVPEGAPLTVLAMAGEVEATGVGGPVELELVTGSAQIDRLAGGRLSVAGNGRIVVDEAAGDLAVAVAGSGDVQVGRATLDALDVELAGTGNVVIDGVAERATVRLAGIGEVRVTEVREQPVVSVAGLGRVAIGNW